MFHHRRCGRSGQVGLLDGPRSLTGHRHEAAIAGPPGSADPGLQEGWVMSGGLRLTVLGAGYLGITRAASMAGLGFDALGVHFVGTPCDPVRWQEAGGIYRGYRGSRGERATARLDSSS